jgi:hypothetical protein
MSDSRAGEALINSSYDLSGYGITATDGEIGKVDEATYESGSGFLVIDIGPLVFGRKVMLPAAIVSGVDHENRRVVVDQTTDQIRQAPDYDPSLAETSPVGQVADVPSPGGSGWGS